MTDNDGSFGEGGRVLVKPCKTHNFQTFSVSCGQSCIVLVRNSNRAVLQWDVSVWGVCHRE